MIFSSLQQANEEISRAQLWGWAIPAALIGYLVCRRRAWLTLFVLPLTLIVPVVALVQGHSDLQSEATWALVLVVLASLIGADQAGLKVWRYVDLRWGHLAKGKDRDVER